MAIPAEHEGADAPDGIALDGDEGRPVWRSVRHPCEQRLVLGFVGRMAEALRASDAEARVLVAWLRRWALSYGIRLNGFAKDEEPPAALREIDHLTPADFAAVKRRAEILGVLRDPGRLVEELAGTRDAAARDGRAIGFRP